MPAAQDGFHNLVPLRLWRPSAALRLRASGLRVLSMRVFWQGDFDVEAVREP